MSGQAVITVEGLPRDAVGAASTFYAEWAGQIARAASEGATEVAVVLPAAGADHSDWRRAAARDLARSAAPVRVNLMAPGGAASCSATLTYLRDAPGVTGHYLVLNDD